LKNRNKIFIGPHEIAGYYINLSNGFSKLGYSIDYVTYNLHRFDYGKCKNIFLVRLIQLIDNKNKKINIKLVKCAFKLLIVFLKYIFFLSCLFKYDVFIFGFGKSLLPHNIDLPVLRIFNKKIISVLSHGSESRPAFIDGAVLSLGRKYSSNSQLVKRSFRIKKLLEFHFKYSDIVIGSPYTNFAYSPSPFINSFNFGVPFYSNRKTKTIEHKEIRILHSPSDPSVKGTQVIVNAINNLTEKGYPIKFILLENKTFEEVINEIQNCDFVVDQVYSDTPMAGFATESAWFGKPAVVGGYKLNELKEFIPQSMWPPVKICHPGMIEQAIEDLIINCSERRDLGRRAMKFVREKWSSVEVAKRFIQLITDDIPDDWWIDPNDICYLEGCGISRRNLKHVISNIIDEYGLKSLHLSHRPELEKAFMDFAYNQDK
jgi:hypothetical protein